MAPRPWSAALVALVALAACAAPRVERALGRRYLLERVDDTNIAQLYADGFEELPLRDKLLCYHLTRAAIAGRDIFLDQRFAYGLELRDVLEELFVHRSALAPAARAEIERFTKLFWVHSGIHHNLTTRKLPFRLSNIEFLAATEAARADGANLPDEERLAVLHGVLTDPATFVSITDKSADDPVAASCNNLYLGVTTADLAGFPERYPLNSRLVKRDDGALVEEVYRMGDAERGIPPGRYAEQIAKVVDHLTDALPYAPDATREALVLLIRYYRSGSPEDWRAFNIAWLADTGSTVDDVNGFVEVYLDARGQKGAWEAVVSFVDQERTAAIERLASEAQWFEDRMPWDPEFRKPEVRGITARAISVVTETGDSGPITPIGFNLPNEADVRQEYGSKSVNLANVVEAYARLTGTESVAEFAWSPDEIVRAEGFAGIDDVHTNLHEVVGHASGRVREDVSNPAQALGPYYSTLEEARADLVGLYWIADPKLQELGMVPRAEAALAQYEAYARNALVQLRRVPPGGSVEEDHMRNRQMIVHWLIAHDGGVAVEHRDGKTYYRVTTAAEFRAGCGRLLAEVMRIKATGDFEAGRTLVATYGVKVDPTLHAEVLARIDRLGLASITGFVQPELELVRDADGSVADVRVRYPMDLAAQMLGWSGRR